MDLRTTGLCIRRVTGSVKRIEKKEGEARLGLTVPPHMALSASG
jgi:hypothetical protein